MVTSLILQLAKGIWFIEPASAEAYKPLVEAILSGKNVDLSFLMPKGEKPRMSQSFIHTSGTSFNTSYSDASNAPAGSIAVTPLMGPIMKNDNCGDLGTSTLAALMQSADNNPNVSAHILHVDSPGGSSDAMFSMSETIKLLNKPVLTFVDGMMASAAYGIGSLSKHIMASHDMNSIGSIGTYTTVRDYRKRNEMNGVKETVVYATKSTEKNKEYLSALEGDTESMQALVDKYNESFLSSVRRNRFGKNLNEEMTLKGQLHFTPDALRYGLIDSVGSFNDAIQKVQSFIK